MNAETRRQPPAPADPARHARPLVNLLDSAFRVPGTRFRFGLDPIIGLIPGLGDVVGGLLSGYIVLLAARAGAPKAVLLRMLANIAVDSALGAVPVLGDLFDAKWKANVRNLALMQRYVEQPRQTRKASIGFLALLLLAVVLLTLAAVVLVVLLVRALLGGVS